MKQTRSSSNKIYSLHEPAVECISKGKEHKKYEFGNKVSLAITLNTGVIVGALGFRKEYDGHTLQPVLEQVSRLTGKEPKTASVDRVYRGNTQIGTTKMQLPKPFTKKQSSYEKTKLKKAHKRRVVIEQVIGHLKTDHRLGRNFCKGIVGDNINILLAATAFNLKRMMNKWKISVCYFREQLFNYFFVRFEMFVFKKLAF